MIKRQQPINDVSRSGPLGGYAFKPEAFLETESQKYTLIKDHSNRERVGVCKPNSVGQLFESINEQALFDLLLKNKISTSNLDFIKQGSRLRFDSSQIKRYTERADAYRDGTSLLISQAYRYFPEIEELHLFLSDGGKRALSTNIYYSPPSSSGVFGPHADSHSVVICQILGEKLFKVREPFLFGKRWVQRSLKPGMMLFIPRGVEHDAMTGEVPSLHLTIGFL